MHSRGASAPPKFPSPARGRRPGDGTASAVRRSRAAGALLSGPGAAPGFILGNGREPSTHSSPAAIGRGAAQPVKEVPKGLL